MLDMHVGLFTLLKEMDAICKKHGITYYLEGGSLLGAVRHKGFLPWDDDVDLCITRDNFKKLLAVIDQELPANRELYCYERFPGYLRDTVKYTNLDSTVIFPNHILDGNACGQHIDLFILDPAPSTPEEQAEYKALACVYSELMMPVYVMCDDIAEYMDLYNIYRQMMKEKGRDYTLNLLREKLFTREDDDSCDTYCIRWGNRHVFYDKAYFGEPATVTFEGLPFPAPRQYYRFLRSQFGDSWMMVPDVFHQEDHNTFDNYHIPCEVFKADYTPYIDFAQAWEDNLKRKNHNLKNLKNKLAIQKNNAAMQRVLHEMSLEHQLRELPDEARVWLENGEYARLAEYFQIYYATQICSDLIRYHMPFQVSEEVLYAAAMALIMTGRFGEAEKLIRLQEKGAPCLSDRIHALLPLIADIRSCMLACEEARFADADELADKWIAQFPLQLNFAAVRIRRDIREDRDTDALISQTRVLLDHYPDSDELLMLLGQLLEKAGKAEEANICFHKVARNSRNGLLLLQLQSRGDITWE